MTPPIFTTSGACRQAGRHLLEGEEVKQYSDPGKRILPVHGTFVPRYLAISTCAPGLLWVRTKRGSRVTSRILMAAAREASAPTGAADS
jgi:hypothetical protein